MARKVQPLAFEMRFARVSAQDNERRGDKLPIQNAEDLFVTIYS
jgi:hypothetical protein